MNPTGNPPLLRPVLFRGFPEVVAGCTTRHGGTSGVPYQTLNLGMNTGDRQEDVQKNRAILFRSLGFDLDTLAVMYQIHGTNVRVIDRPGFYEGVDGFVTQTSGIVLCVGIADCAALLFVDPVRQVIGACHAGWRGVAGGISGETVKSMHLLGARPAHIRVFVSPCISVAHFEVGEEVASQFNSTYVERTEGRAKPHVNLKAALKDQLLDTGIQSDHIEMATQCTYAQNDTFFSFRADGGRTGRMMGFIGLR